MIKMLDTLLQGDCIELMAELPRDSVDLVITDPPFAIDFKSSRSNYNRNEENVLDGYVEINVHDYASFTKDWMVQAQKALKWTGSMYIFSGWNHLKDLLNAIDDCGLTVVNHLIWKYQFGVVTTRKYVTSHYHCLYVCKDDKVRFFNPYCRFRKDDLTVDGGSAHYKDKEDVWTINREYWTGAMKTPTKLPRELIAKILDYSSKQGDVILDPFMGSGQVPFVSKEKGRQYVGFEIVPEYFEFAKQRIETNQYLIPKP